MRINLITNSLLAIIAICLILITIKMYNVGFVSPAYSQWSGRSLTSESGLVPVALHAKHSNGSWFPCQISSGDKLYVEIAK